MLQRACDRPLPPRRHACILLAAHLCNENDTKLNAGLVSVLYPSTVRSNTCFTALTAITAPTKLGVDARLTCREKTNVVLAPATNKDIESTSGRYARHPRRWAADFVCFLPFFLFFGSCALALLYCCALHLASCAWRAFHH